MTAITEIRDPAQVYDQEFVPALFRPWGPVVAGLAKVGPGDRVLDVACGTGALTLTLAELAGPSASVVGLDANPGMLSVARRKAEGIEWIEARAEALPFPDADFDGVTSQFGLMFFEDKAKALREMWRVLRPNGGLAVAVCDAIENSPGYAALAGLLDRLFGRLVGDAFRAPFSLGDRSRLATIAHEAGIPSVEVVQHHGTVRFDSIAALVGAERACVWTLGGLLDDEQFSRLLKEAEVALRPFAAKNGATRFDMPALIVTARKA